MPTERASDTATKLRHSLKGPLLLHPRKTTRSGKSNFHGINLKKDRRNCHDASKKQGLCFKGQRVNRHDMIRLRLEGRGTLQLQRRNSPCLIKIKKGERALLPTRGTTELLLNGTSALKVVCTPKGTCTYAVRTGRGKGFPQKADKRIKIS